MSELCRHLLPAGHRCTQPAVNKTLYCRHHQVIKRALGQVKPKYDKFEPSYKLPFVFPEDRAAIQLNYAIVMAALNGDRISIQLANAYNRLLRSCEINLSRGPLTDPDREDEAVEQVILTPEGEEVGERHHDWDHGPKWDSRFREEKRAAAAAAAEPVKEQHHRDCQCATCETSKEELKLVDENHPEQTNVSSAEEPAETLPNACPEISNEESALTEQVPFTNQLVAPEKPDNTPLTPEEREATIQEIEARYYSSPDTIRFRRSQPTHQASQAG